MQSLYYTGIGSRRTPQDKLDLMVRLAQHLAQHDFILRSGGAVGADTAFENGCDLETGRKEIYLPWNGFNGRLENALDGVFAGVSPSALELAEAHHPNWAACSPGARHLHARNCYQVLGLNLDTPSIFVLCWTPGGTGSGGTGQAIRIARAHNVPVFDLGSSNVLTELETFLQSVS